MGKPTARARILVVDDEPALRTSLTRTLGLEGYRAEAVASGAECMALLADRAFDALILDVSMPGGIDGMEVCRRVRAQGSQLPILMLTARDAVDDRVMGLDAGADDYLVKPFALRELIARLHALLRRTDSGGQSALVFGSVTLDRDAHTVTRGDRQIDLSLTEFSLLETFMQHPRQVLSRTQIFEGVWGYDFGPSSNALGVYVGYLRRKLEAGGESRLIHTVRGVGYAMREEA